jgi:hypothetical protein
VTPITSPHKWPMLFQIQTEDCPHARRLVLVHHQARALVAQVVTQHRDAANPAALPACRRHLVARALGERRRCWCGRSGGPGRCRHGCGGGVPGGGSYSSRIRFSIRASLRRMQCWNGVARMRLLWSGPAMVLNMVFDFSLG